MKARPVSFTLKINGMVSDASDEELLVALKEVLTGVVGFTLEMNGIDGANVVLEKDTVSFGPAEDFDIPTQEEKLADVARKAAEQFEDVNILNRIVDDGPGPDDTIH